MLFNKRSHLDGTHAFLSASKYHWLNYDDDKLVRAYRTAMAAKRGTELHALAHELIRLGEPLPDRRRTLNLYVNDALEFGMTSEQLLYYSDNCYGTPDTISFRDNLLRIHDLKTGATATSEWQLIIYAALFCIEYGFVPDEIQMQLRIYQNDEVRVYTPEPETILRVMKKIVNSDKIISVLRLEEQA